MTADDRKKTEPESALPAPVRLITAGTIYKYSFYRNLLKTNCLMVLFSY